MPSDIETLPAGKVFFLLTDIENSTPLWEKRQEWMREAAARSEELIKNCFRKWGGSLPKDQGEGDSFVAAFKDGAATAACATAIQTALAAEWPSSSPSIRVRIGIHCGDIAPTDGNYRGPVLIRAARIRDAGHGGQTLLSRAAAEAIREKLPGGARLVELGLHRFKGVTLPERVFQLTQPELPANFPALRSPRYASINLPSQISSFVGRERELADLEKLLNSNRLLTLSGPGGVGKTRLALQLATRASPEFEDGTTLVDLSFVSMGDTLPATASALDLDDSGVKLAESVIDRMRDKELLLVFDNCEHLLPEIAGLARNVLSHCPAVKAIATSRHPLGIEGEVVWRVPQLGLEESVALFTERAKARSPQFHATEETESLVGEIATRLDGLPLAIELAARLPEYMSLDDIRDGLDERLELLAGDSAGRPPRHQSLRAVFEWSYDLLDTSAQDLLRRVAVFRGSFSVQAADSIVEDARLVDLRRTLAELVTASLIEFRPGRRSSRYHLMDSIRAYALEKLTEGGDASQAQERYLAWAISTATQSAPHLRGPEQTAWLDRHDEDHDSLLGAIDQAIEGRRVEESLDLASSLWWFWYVRGHLAEGRRRLDAVADLVEGIQSPVRAAVLRGAASLAYVQGDRPRAANLAEKSLELSRSMSDEPGIAASLNILGNVALSRGRVDEAKSLFQQSLKKGEESGNEHVIGTAVSNLGHAALAAGNQELAIELYRRGLAVARESGDLREVIRATFLLARLRHESSEALPLYEEALRLSRELNSKTHIGHSLLGVASVRINEGKWNEAKGLLEEALDLGEALGEKELIGYSLLYLGEVYKELGDSELSKILLEQTVSLAETTEDASLLASAKDALSGR
ncbi:MAG TPA: tetratricopeptide repeat protein [Actinomycetota bacterium]|nr:tetratricopeptide repeat protein [Actinomycetota bacterium]